MEAGHCEGLSLPGERDRALQHQFDTQGNDMDSANDLKAHTSTYSSFIGLLKWVIPTLALITLLIVVLIAD